MDEFFGDREILLLMRTFPSCLILRKNLSSRKKGNNHAGAGTVSFRHPRFPFFFCIIRAEFPAAVAFPFGAGLDMDGDRCPRVLGVQVDLEVVGQVVGLDNGDIPGHDKVELDEDLRPERRVFRSWNPA